MGKSSFHSKLARLRREGAALSDRGPDGGPDRGCRPLPPATPPADSKANPSGLPAWFGKRLTKREAAATNRRPGEQPVGARPSGDTGWPTTTGDPQALEAVERPEGSFAVRIQRLPLEPSYRHGDWTLDEIDGADPASIARLARDPSLASLDLRRSVFLDTETSGLSGGAGVYVYMVGLGYFDGDEYVSWQSFLRHPGEERAMLAEVADRVRSRDSVVSFFGKSFDRHRLEDKMRIVGVDPPFEGRAHLDLYHPFRRLTQGRFPNAKLQTMERELLRFQRERDLPGSLAPAAWFDYLANRPHLLEGVFLHNREDVLSLVALSAYLGRAERETRRSGAELVGPACRRAAALAETASDPVERLRWAEVALARGAVGPDRRRMQLLAAELHRQRGAVAEARAAYRSALEECADDRIAVDLFTGASMLLEHRVGDRVNALAMAERALALGQSKRIAAGQLAALTRRVERLSAASRGASSPNDSQSAEQ